MKHEFNVVQIWCLPDASQGQYEELYKRVLRRCMSMVPTIEGPADVTILFPADQMNHGLGTDIVIMSWFDTLQLSGNISNLIKSEVQDWLVSIEFSENRTVKSEVF